MNLYLTLLLLFALALVQSTVMPHLLLFDVHPDLVLMVVLSWSLLRGAEEGMLWALIGGVALDLLSGARFGVQTLPLLIVGFVSGLGERAIFRSEILMPIIAIPLATLVQQLMTMALLHITGWPVSWGTSIQQITLPSMLANTLCMPLVYLVVRLLHRRTTREKITW